MKKWYAAAIALSLIADRFSKQWALKVLPEKPGQTVPLWDQVFHLTYVENRGAAFGMMQGQHLFFYLITAALTLYLLFVLFVRKPQSPACGVGMALVLGGAWGNCYDRVMYGFVVDMLDFRLIHFPVFNLADTAICVGVGLWLLFYLLEDIRQNAKAKEAA